MRLTLDIDGLKRNQLLYSIIKINQLFYHGIIDEIYMSSSKKGYHIIIYGLKITFEDCINFRKMLGDDRRRIYIDKIRDRQGHSTQVLFDYKGRKKSKKLYDRKRNINILPVELRSLV